MGKFLDSFLKTMPDIQRNSLKELLEVDKGSLTVYERDVVKQQIETLIERVGKDSQYSFQGLHQEGKARSTIHNSNMEEISFDLRVLFKLLNTIDVYMGNHLNLTQSEMQSIQKQIYQLRKELERVKLLLKAGDSISEYIHEDFKVPQWTEIDRLVIKPLLKGRSNVQLSEAYLAEVGDEGLTLSTSTLSDQLTTSFGLVMGTIKVNRVTAVDSAVAGHEISQAIDSSMETYWMEHILTDTPIEGQYSGASLVTGNNYEGVGGAIVEVEITLDHLIALSELSLHPFTNYPLEVYAIYAWGNRDFSGERYTLVSEKQARHSTDKMSFHFPTQRVGTIVLVLRQVNYTKENYMVRLEELQNKELWKQLEKQSIRQYVEDGDDIDALKARNEVTGFNLYQAAMEKYGKTLSDDTQSKDFQHLLSAIQKGLTPDGLSVHFGKNIMETENHTTFVEVKKYSYIIGAYHIALNAREYQEESLYITKSLPVSVNANRLTLEVDESHRWNYSEGSYPETSIEYYATTSKNPSLHDWFNICPLNHKRIDGERLMGDFIPEVASGFRTAVYRIHSLRFPILSNTEVTLRRNGKLIPSAGYSISVDRLKVGIKEKYFSPASIYTISYIPEQAAYYVDLNKVTDNEPTQFTNEQGGTGEVFEGIAPGATLTLSYTPHIKRSYLLKENRSEKKTKQIEGITAEPNIQLPLHVWADDVRLLDITNYDSATFDPERLKENNGYTFGMIKNKIYLGTPNDRAIFSRVTVDYRYILMNIRLKAILRRNTNKDTAISPTLKKYTLRIETKDLEGQA